MDLRHLRLFLHLATSLHFTRTARAMHVSAPTLSRAIQRLEEEVGRPLFERNRRNVVLTNAGIQLVEFARKTLNDWQQLEARFLQDDHSQLTGRLPIFCSVTASYSYLINLLTPFRHYHPKVDIQLSTGDPADALDWLKDGRVDLAIAAKPDEMPAGLEFIELGDIPLQLLVPQLPCPVTQILNQQPLPWEELPFIMAERGVTRVRIAQWCARMGFTPSIHAEVAGHEAIVSMVSLGLGVGVAPQRVVEMSPMRHRIRHMETPEPFGPFTVILATYKRHLQDPKVQAMWQIAQQQIN